MNEKMNKFHLTVETAMKLLALALDEVQDESTSVQIYVGPHSMTYTTIRRGDIIADARYDDYSGGEWDRWEDGKDE